MPLGSLAVVGGFFIARQALDLEGLNTPLEVGGLAIGGPVGVVAGVLLVGLGVREYRLGPHDHVHAEPNGGPTGRFGRFRSRLPGGGHHPTAADLDRTGLAGIVWTAFVLGFVHEEEFEVIGLCLGSSICFELMLAYAVAVMVALVGLTMLLVAGYYRYEDRMQRTAAHFPTISAVVLVTMGVGFVLGLF